MTSVRVGRASLASSGDRFKRRRAPPDARYRVIALSVGLMNVTTYAFTMLAARILGPAAYGAMAGLMATVLVIGVIQLGVQATAARRWQRTPGNTWRSSTVWWR